MGQGKGESAVNTQTSSGPKPLIYALIFGGFTAAQHRELDIEHVTGYGGFDLVRGPAAIRESLHRLGVCHKILTGRTHIHLRVGTLDTAGGIIPVPPELRQTGTGLHLVQLIGPIKPEWAVSLEAHGTIHDYIPNYTFVMDLNEDVIPEIAGSWFVQWVGPYHPAYRIDRRLLTTTDDRALAVFYGCPSGDRLRPFGVKPSAIGRCLALRAGGRQFIALCNQTRVAFVEPLITPGLHNDKSRRVLQTERPHASGLTGTDQTAAVTDTGTYRAHECFVRRGKIAAFIDLAGDARRAGGDGNGHGTHCAGSAVGDSPPSHTANRLDGQAPGARLIPVKVFSNDGTWSGGTDLHSVWAQAYQAGARVNSNSWGADAAGAYRSFDAAADSVTNEFRDYVLVISAGNLGGRGRATIGSPGAFKNGITVGALVTDSPDEIARFSSRGPTADGRIKPDLIAPGDGVRSAQAGTKDGYVSMQGTSMATPQVAGAALLVREYFQRGFYPTGTPVPTDAFTPSAALVKALLINGAVEMTGAQSDIDREERYPNNTQGWGRVSLRRSLCFSGGTRRIVIWDNPASLSTGEFWTGTLTIPARVAELKFTLAWTDHPGSAGGLVALQNDLHLKVTTPAGVEFAGNNFARHRPGYSLPGGEFDDRNTVEGVHLIPGLSVPGKLPEGQWIVQVIGANVPRGVQNFSIVAGYEGEASNAR